MNIYQMYKHNDNKVGFWVRRRTWGKTIAQVKFVGNKTSGKLKGRAPYHNNPEVLCELYDLRTGKKTQNKCGANYEKDELTILSCPGTYSYFMIDVEDVIDGFQMCELPSSADETNNLLDK